MTNIPTYILFLFAIISIVLSYIVLTWIFDKFIKPVPENMVEGYTNPQYKYIPSSSSPNLYIQFGISDLAVDVSSACGFIKVDSKLINPTVPASTTNSNVTGATTGSSTITPAPYSSETPAKTSNPSNKESFDTNDGSSSTPTETTDSSSANPTVSATTTPSSTQSSTRPPIPTSAATPSANSNNDYTVPYTQLQIYKMYNTASGYSSTSNTNIYKMMDASYSSFFDSSGIANMSDANIAKMWNSTASIIIDDALYSGTDFFAIQSTQGNRKCEQGLSYYFLQQIQKNKANTSVLLSLKNAYYGIIKPRFLANTVSNVYWQNAQSLTNSDKGTFNSVIFVLNTIGNLASTNTLSADLSANDVAKVVSSDTPFTMDSLWLYQIMSVAFELYRFCANFQNNGASTSGSGSPAITTTSSTFISGYQKYLEKVNQTAPQSPLLFLLQNLPSNSECSVVNKLSSYANNISN